MNQQPQMTAQDQRAARAMRQSKIMSIIAAGALALVFIVAMAMWVYLRAIDRNATVTERDQVSTDGNLAPTADESAVANVADKASKSVVSIITNIEESSSLRTTTRQSAAAGTGIIVSKDGYIVTNKHVVSKASSIRVIASDGTRYDDVRVVGEDPLNDIAYLKLEVGNTVLTPLSLGDSATVRVGQSVVAIGNALGRYQNTVTSGIISGKGRPVTASTSGNSTQRTESLTDLIQTDAAVNSGNSGGPLLNRSGQVIGINVAVATNAHGISFAIPVNAMKGTLKSVLAGKGVRRAYLGARYVMLTPDIAKQVGTSAKEGAYVMTSGDKSAIVAGSPADKAGLREKDVITKINSLVVGKQGDVSSLIGEYQPGDVVALTILRDGKERVVRVTLSEYQGGESGE